MIEKNLILIRGCSGSGKSTYIKNNFPTAFICSADYYHIDINGNYNWSFDNMAAAHIFSKNACKAAMINNVPVIVIDNTNTLLEEIKPYIEMANQYDYKVIVIRLVVLP